VGKYILLFVVACAAIASFFMNCSGGSVEGTSGTSSAKVQTFVFVALATGKVVSYIANPANGLLQAGPESDVATAKTAICDPRGRLYLTDGSTNGVRGNRWSAGKQWIFNDEWRGR